MSTCPKCGGPMSGPIYKPSGVRGAYLVRGAYRGAHHCPSTQESLLYTCTRCGYRAETPTMDEIGPNPLYG